MSEEEARPPGLVCPTHRVPECGAKKRRSKRICHHRSSPGKRCRLHGGTARVGIAVNTYKHGRHSKYLPQGLLAKFREAYYDPNLISLRSEIALTDARMNQLLERVHVGDGESLWAKAGASMEAAIAAQTEASRAPENSAEQKALVEKANARLAEHFEFVRAGVADSSTWNEISSLVEQRRKLAESERKRAVEMQQFIAVGNVAALFETIAESLKTHVKDPHALTAVSADLGRLLTAGAPAAIPPDET